MATLHDVGRLGFGIVGGQGIEHEIFKNRVVQGVMIQASTTGSSQLTGTGNGTYLYDITAGLVAVDGTVLEVAAAADEACEAAANIMASLYEVYYLIIFWKHPTTGVVTKKVVKGTPALSTAGAAVPTITEVEAGLPAGAVWVAAGTMLIKRTADTTVTETVDNTVRPSLIPSSVHNS